MRDVRGHRTIDRWGSSVSELRDAYATLKERLARQFPNDREAYIDGKTAFVREVVGRRS